MANRKKFAAPVLTHCPELGIVTPVPSNPDTVISGACEISPVSQDDRADEARRLRRERAFCAYRDERCETNAESIVCAHPCNGDETFYFQSPVLPDGTPNPYQKKDPDEGEYPASYTKGLPHNPGTGLAEPKVYQLLLKALATNDPEDFENVRPLGCEGRGQRALENPQSGLAFELEGADPAALFMPPAPCFASEQEAAEIAELYWMALARDVPFSQYATDPTITDSVNDLNIVFDSHLSPHLPFPLTNQTVFRGPTAGDRIGPYVSQFLLLDVPYGAQFIPAAISTLMPQIDYLTGWDDWLSAQNGCDANQTNCDPMPRLIRNGRDLAQFVHVDRDFNAFLNACQLLLFGRAPLRRCEARPGLGVPFGPCLPYVNAMAPPAEEFEQSRNPRQGKSENQIGQGTFGDQYIKSVLVGATYRAFHAVWYQKWFVHRRLRPEEFGGRVHLRRLHDGGITVNPKHNFPISLNLFNSTLFTENRLFEYNARQNANRRTPSVDMLGRPSDEGTYLLPMAYAEGSPLHPSYGSGHSVVSGCLATILKAFFHNDWQFRNPVESNEDGTSLRPYRPTVAQEPPLTVAGELDKLASNVGLGRLWAGVHWRSDHEESLLLGEQLAVSILCDQRNLFNEYFEFRFRSFDFGRYEGKVVRIRPSGSKWDNKDDICELCVQTIDAYEQDCDRERRPGAP